MQHSLEGPFIFTIEWSCLCFLSQGQSFFIFIRYHDWNLSLGTMRQLQQQQQQHLFLWSSNGCFSRALIILMPWASSIEVGRGPLDWHSHCIWLITLVSKGMNLNRSVAYCIHDINLRSSLYPCPLPCDFPVYSIKRLNLFLAPWLPGEPGILLWSIRLWLHDTRGSFKKCPCGPGWCGLVD